MRVQRLGQSLTNEADHQISGEIMNKKLLSIILSVCLVAILAACSSTPSGNPPSGTMPANPSGTMPAGGPGGSVTSTVAATVIAATDAPTVTSTPAPTATATPVTYSATAILSIGCLKGPADTYEITNFVKSGDTFTALGRDDANDYYLIQSTSGTQYSCWIWKNYITINGNAYTLPVATVAPTK